MAEEKPQPTAQPTRPTPKPRLDPRLSNPLEKQGPKPKTRSNKEGGK